MRVSSLFRLSISLFLSILLIFFSYLLLASGHAPISQELRARVDPTLRFQQVFDNGGSTIADTHLLTFRNIQGEIMPMVAP